MMIRPAHFDGVLTNDSDKQAVADHIVKLLDDPHIVAALIELFLQSEFARHNDLFIRVKVLDYLGLPKCRHEQVECTTCKTMVTTND